MDDGKFQNYVYIKINVNMFVRPLYNVATAYRHGTNDFVIMGNVKQQKFF